MKFVTVTQKQCLLAYLGYYRDAIDGIWGAASVKATDAFQQDHGLNRDGIFGEETRQRILETIFREEDPRKEKTDEDFWEDIEFFTREEFRCKCGGKYCDGFPVQMRERVVRIADAARRHFGRPGHVISGLRCKTWNSIQGGVENSQHLYGEAVDLRIDGITADQLMAFLATQPHRYSYRINSTNVHVDIPKGKR